MSRGPSPKKPPFNGRQIERLRYLRDDEGLTLKEIARLMGSSANTIGCLLRGIRAASAAPRPIVVKT